MCWFDTFVYRNMIITTVLASTSFMSLNYHFFFAVKIFTIYFLSEVQVCHAMLLTIITIVKVKVTQLCLRLCNPIDYTVHGILKARILEWVAFPSSRGSFQPSDWIHISCGSCIAGQFFTTEPLGQSLDTVKHLQIPKWISNHWRARCKVHLPMPFRPTSL